jgi:hypothetical protein
MNPHLIVRRRTGEVGDLPKDAGNHGLHVQPTRAIPRVAHHHDLIHLPVHNLVRIQIN